MVAERNPGGALLSHLVQKERAGEPPQVSGADSVSVGGDVAAAAAEATPTQAHALPTLRSPNLAFRPFHSPVCSLWHCSLLEPVAQHLLQLLMASMLWSKCLDVARMLT